MSINLRLSRSLCGRKNGLSHIHKSVMCRFYNTVPFLDLYERTTGDKIPEDYLPTLKKKHPNIDSLSHDRLQCTLQILRKFNIDEVEACLNLHVFTMNPITMDNYGEILRECGFVKVLPQHIIKYHTIVRSRTIARLKKEGFLRDDLRLEKVIYDKLDEWPATCKTFENFSDSDTSILTVRTRILEKYLNWRISVTSEEFNKFCRNYLPLRHKPMSDIKEALDIAQNVIKFDVEGIKRNGFVISSDPVNTKLILKNVVTLAGLDIQEVIRIEPAILKNNYNALLQIRDILEEYRIPEDAQRRCFKVYCMNPKTVRERLDELSSLKEYRVLSTNPRVLTMVVHKKKMMNRLSKIQAAKKHCYSLNHLVSSSKIFNNYISSFGNKVCGRDIAILINSSLKINNANKPKTNIAKEVSMQLKKHKYWLHTALDAIDENIKFLKQKFNDEIILNNCHLLLYPVTEVENHINNLLNIRSGTVKISDRSSTVDPYFNNIKHGALTDNQILSLVLYEIEKRYHFSGDGIWARQDGVKTDTQLS